MAFKEDSAHWLNETIREQLVPAIKDLTAEVVRLRDAIERPVEVATLEVGRKCRVCGCTDARACEGGCSWVRDDLCSRCEGKETR
jgi:hypothetical protein